MRALVQRVRRGSVRVGETTMAEIGAGYVVLLGVRKGDTLDDARALAEKCALLRVLGDSSGKMNLSLRDTGGGMLVVSQFTLYADARRGHRPGFSDAAPPEDAEAMYSAFIDRAKAVLGESRVQCGAFGAMMEVTIVNDGPVTILLESNLSQQQKESP